MKTARQRVWDFIRLHKLVTTADISRGLQMTRANARHHLEILINQELVEIAGKNPTTGKGRPSIVYGISQRVLGENLNGLADALLSIMIKSGSTNERIDLYRHVADQMSEPEKLASPENFRKSGQLHLTRRLSLAVQQLNTWHYHARWEARSESPHVILGNCPYLSILSEHPELCEIDRRLIENLVDTSMEQIAKRIPDERGYPFCLFRAKKL
jgi:predicted ArsR family transcriptional regulator